MSFFEVRPSCPKCGMNMVRVNTRFECLRCGYAESPAPPKNAGGSADPAADRGAASSRIAYAAANWPSG
jgi:hypothetical protein